MLTMPQASVGLWKTSQWNANLAYPLGNGVLHCQGSSGPKRELQPLTIGWRDESKGVEEESIGDRLVDSFTAQSLDLPPQAAKVQLSA